MPACCCVTQPLGTAARLTRYVIAWWSGRDIVFAYLRQDNETLIDEEFDPGDLQWDEWVAVFEGWCSKPVFEQFDEIE